MKNLKRIGALGLLLAVVGCAGDKPQQSKELKGSGSTFIAPLMAQWASRYEATVPGFKIDYRSIGSYGGIKNFLDKKVDFACTDALSPAKELDQARAAGGEVLQIPLVLGALVPAYNLPGMEETLRFTGPVLAEIYLGHIKKWNEQPLAELNPGVKLPDKEIVVVHRRDGSGTTHIWTAYLSKVSPQWRDKVGVGFEVKWPTGEAESGNQGVAAKVKETPGSIGYVELAYAYQHDLAFGRVQNRDKEFVKGSLGGATAAAANAGVKTSEDLETLLIDAAGKDSYPITGATWAVVYAKQPADKKEKLVGFLRWALDEGQQRVHEDFYARLPKAVVEVSDKLIDRIQASK